MAHARSLIRAHAGALLVSLLAAALPVYATAGAARPPPASGDFAVPAGTSEGAPDDSDTTEAVSDAIEASAPAASAPVARAAIAPAPAAPPTPALSPPPAAAPVRTALAPAPAPAASAPAPIAPAPPAPAAVAAAPAAAAPAAPVTPAARPARATIASTAQVARPDRGSMMNDVEARYGAPASRQAAVGQPPITRWDYPGLVVYFEGERVIHAVLVRGD